LIKDGAIMVARRYQHLGHLGRFSTSSRRDAWCVRHGPQVQLRLHRSATRGSNAAGCISPAQNTWSAR